MVKERIKQGIKPEDTRRLRVLLRGLRVLEAIHQKSESFVTEISNTTGKLPTSVNLKIKELEECGFIESVGYRSEGRGVRKYYRLTKRGVDALEKLKTFLNEV